MNFEAMEVLAGCADAMTPDFSLRVDHIGIAVWSIDASRAAYAAMGMVAGPVETIPHEQVRTAMISLGNGRIELIEAVGDDSTVARFLKKRGEGLHHIALFADQVDVKFRQLKEKGVRLGSDSVRTGAGGHRYFFVHPASAGGVLIEIVGNEVHFEVQDDASSRREQAVQADRTGTDG